MIFSAIRGFNGTWRRDHQRPREDDMQARGHLDACGDILPAFVEISLVRGVLCGALRADDFSCRKARGKVIEGHLFSLNDFANEKGGLGFRGGAPLLLVFT
jgi:hypothetical protein